MQVRHNSKQMAKQPLLSRHKKTIPKEPKQSKDKQQHLKREFGKILKQLPPKKHRRSKEV
jgi:hypothetical protein